MNHGHREEENRPAVRRPLIAREGWPLLLGLLALAGLSAALGAAWPAMALLWLAAVLVALGAFVAFFFRDPERPIDGNPLELVSPADGKVLAVSSTTENRFLHGPATVINIFLSPMDVHVNRSPTSGRVAYQEYVPGKYVVAFAPKASEINERNYIGLEVGGERMLVCQVAGIAARRIVTWVKPGQELAKGERIGMIKFGSMTQLFLPATMEVAVKPGDRVVGGLTVVGRRVEGLAIAGKWRR